MKVYLVYIEDSEGILSQVLGIADSIEGIEKIASGDMYKPELCSDEYTINCRYKPSKSDPLSQVCLAHHERCDSL